MVLIFKVKGDIINRVRYRAMKLLEHRMKVMERLPEKFICGIVTISGKFWFYV